MSRCLSFRSPDCESAAPRLPCLPKVVGNDLDDALCVGRFLRRTAFVEHGDRGGFALALEIDAVLQGGDAGIAGWGTGGAPGRWSRGG